MQQAIGALIGQAKKKNPNIDPGKFRATCLASVRNLDPKPDLWLLLFDSESDQPRQAAYQAAMELPFARIQLLRSPNIGPVSFAQLLRRFGSAQAAIEALPDLASRGGSVATRLARSSRKEWSGSAKGMPMRSHMPTRRCISEP